MPRACLSALADKARHSSLNAAPLSPDAVTNGPSTPQPASREDALSERLRVLRNSPGPQSKPSPSALTALPTTGSPSDAEGRLSSVQGDSGGGPVTPSRKLYEIPSSNASGGSNSAPTQYDDWLPPVDEQALDDLLEDLGFDAGGGGIEDEAGYHEDGGGAAGRELWTAADPKDEAQRIQELLDNFQAVTIKDSAASAAGREQGEDSDDSDGEQMGREVSKVLEQVQDEVELHRTTAAEASTTSIGAPASTSGSPGSPPNSGSARIDSRGGQSAGGRSAHDELSLPTVPSQLVDPVDETAIDGDEDVASEIKKSLDFENDITVRMAALRGLGSGINTDSFGLPSAPTFQPDERSPKPNAGKKEKGAGYTDEDQKTWCIVCLEDATVRCTGCDDDVYCSRCWRDMHVGPAAGYDERGHKGVKFEKGV
jgi:hypothetical protein